MDASGAWWPSAWAPQPHVPWASHGAAVWAQGAYRRANDEQAPLAYWPHAAPLHVPVRFWPHYGAGPHGMAVCAPWWGLGWVLDSWPVYMTLLHGGRNRYLGFFGQEAILHALSLGYGPLGP